jgi:hypothetical protein
MAQLFFKFSTKRETVTANAARSHPESEEKQRSWQKHKTLERSTVARNPFFQWRSYSAVNDTTTKPNGNDDGGLSEEAVRQTADNSRF